MSDFTPEEIEWARKELILRINENNKIERRRAEPWLERCILVARSRRSRAAGLSRARHHALLKFVEGSDGR
ncbi:MAG: hypothetical protein WC026_16780 [Hyphomicrobium sp.]|uniref:hypothetical protein n=1 Tax=Hyphomicrobium sp. TaxID=82 RepID=UPI003561C75F